MKGTAKGICTVALLVIVGMYARAWYESASWLSQGEFERDRGEVEQAISSLRRSVSWYAPLLPYSGIAFDELIAIGHNESNSSEIRKLALEEAKRGLSASRSFLDLFSGRDLQIRRLSQEIASSYSSNPARAVVKEMYPPRIRYSFQFLAQLCFFGWVSMVLVGIWTGSDSAGTMMRRPALFATVGWLLFFGVWLIALRLA